MIVYSGFFLTIVSIIHVYGEIIGQLCLRRIKLG